MAEKFALKQMLRQRGAVDGEEGLVGAIAHAMDRARHQLLARAGFALDQYRYPGRADTGHQAKDFGHLGTRARNVVEQFALGEIAPQSTDLGSQGLFGGLQLIDLGGIADCHRDTVGERFQQHQILVAERFPSQRVNYFDDAQASADDNQGRSENRSRGEPGMTVYQRVETFLVSDVVHFDRPAPCERFSGDPECGGKTQLRRRRATSGSRLARYGK